MFMSNLGLGTSSTLDHYVFVISILQGGDMCACMFPEHVASSNHIMGDSLKTKAINER